MGQVLVGGRKGKKMFKILFLLVIAPLLAVAVFGSIFVDQALNTAKWVMIKLIKLG